MNLVAKEFIASRVSGDGVLILSEMAGASKELFEAILINPFDKNAMADALLKAITMPIEEQKQRNIGMQKRLSRYTVDYWAKDFMKALQSKNEIKEEIQIPKIHNGIQQKLVQAFAKAKNKMIFLDYDGTLVAFNEKPDLAIPDTNLLSIIDTLCKLPNTDVAIVSGRDQAFLDKWFAKLPVTLVAEHGHYIKRKDAEWKGSVTGKKEWMADVLPIFETFTDRTPGTFIEEKHNSLVWHYRKTDPELAAGRVVEIKTVLSSLISDEVTILDMDKALEVVDRQVNKGSAVFEIKNQGDYDFILCIGDDVTDENMFVSLPDHAYTVKVGRKPTAAKYYIESVAQVKALLLGIVP
jgi:trehalose 6-phosphate synthase/phosphatase